jgi:hypothetical protein
MTIIGPTNSNQEEKDSLIKQKFNTLINAESYKIKLEELMKNDNINEYYSNNEMNFSINFKENYENIETNFINDNYYNYKGKQILATQTRKQEITWFYAEDNSYEKQSDYKTLFLNLLKGLSNENYQQENDKYITSNGEKIYEHINKIYSLGTGTQKFEDDKRVKFSYVVDSIEINLKNNEISNIAFIINQSCKIEYPNECTKTKKIVLTFSDINKINPVIPETVQKSLQKNTAGKWVGTYRYEKMCENCDKPILEEKTLILTNKFSKFSGLGWDLEYFTNSDKDFNSGIEVYYIEDNNFYILDNLGEVIEQGHIYEDKIELLDKNGKVKETYLKQ